MTAGQGKYASGDLQNAEWQRQDDRHTYLAWIVLCIARLPVSQPLVRWSAYRHPTVTICQVKQQSPVDCR
jgi:hypothetical protein